MLRYVSHFAEQRVSDTGIVISRYTFDDTPYIYKDVYTDITGARAWLETINRPRRDVIAIFGRLIGSLLESRGNTCRRRNRTSVPPLSDRQSKLCPLKRNFRRSQGNQTKLRDHRRISQGTPWLRSCPERIDVNTEMKVTHPTEDSNFFRKILPSRRVSPGIASPAKKKNCRSQLTASCMREKRQ